MHFQLLMISIQEEPPGSIPDDNDAIRRWLSLPSGSVEADKTWRRVKPQIFAAWSLRDKRWFNAGMVETIERQRRYQERYEIGTKNGGNRKKKKYNNNSESQSELFDQVEVKEIERDKTSVDNLGLVVDQVGHLYPANSHLKGRSLPDTQQQAIAGAIAKDGVHTVLSGTRSFAEKVENWPSAELRFIPNPVKFYTEGQYLKKPEFWERRKENGREECTVHPDSGLTQWGTCWACYATKYTSDCEPA